MKNIAKILCFVLSLVLVFTLIGVSTFADSATVVKSEAALRSALTTGGNIKLGSNIEVTEQIEIPAGVTATLNLNGYTLSGAATSADRHIYPLRNNGNLTINDTIGTGAVAGRGIYNGTEGTDGTDVVLTVNGAKILSQDYNGGAGVWGYGANSKVYLNDATIIGNTGVVSSQGYLEINGGTYICNSGIDDAGKILTSPTYNVRAYNGLKITDGEFTSRHGVISLGGGEGVIEKGSFTIEFAAATTSNVVYVYGDAKLTVNNGEFLSDNTSGKADSGTAVLSAGADSTVVINDGTFVGMNGMVSINDNTVINGGSFDTVWNYNHYGNITPAVPAGTTIYVAGDAVLKNEDGTVTEAANVKMGDTYYATLADAIAAVGAGNVVIELNNDATFDYGARMAYGTEETLSLTINGNGHTLYLNQTNNDWSSLGLKNADATLIFNNVTIEKIGKGDTNGAWNTHAIIVTSKLEMNNVTVNQSLAVQKDTVLNNVDINEANGYYGLWITADGQSVTFNGGSITATNGGRGVKIADQYREATAASVTLNLTDVKFTTAKKAAVLVTSTAGAAITASGVDITNVAADSDNVVWVDEARATHFDQVTLNNDYAYVEGGAESYGAYVAINGKAGYYKTFQEVLNLAVAGSGNVVVDILADIDLTGINWTPVTVSAPNYPVVTVNGNNHSIIGLNNMLFAGTWAGKSGLIINDLTIKNADIQNDVDDVKGNVGVGAFVGFPQASATVTLNNCHLVDSKVSGGHWTGGLVGYAAGYAGNDGPVFMNLTIKNCSVIGNTITGKGSVGGVIGHGSGNGWTNVVITNTIVRDNTITSTGDSNVKAGSVVGTIGAAGQPTTANGITLTGGMSVDAVVSGNTVTSNGTTITTIYGRQGSSTGKLVLVGGSYDNYPIESGVAYAGTKDGYRLITKADGTFGVTESSSTPEIGSNGNWWIGGVDTGLIATPSVKAEDCDEHGVKCWYLNGACTGVQAVGTDGVLPTVEVVEGYWYINGTPTGIKAQGAPGVTILTVHKDVDASDDLVSTYIITFSNGQTWSFTVTNGVDGDEGLRGPQGPEGPKGDKGPQGLPGNDGNDKNTTVIVVIAIATVGIIFTLAVVFYRGVGRRSWWCTR